MKQLTVLSLAAFLALGVTANAAIDNVDIGGDIFMEYFMSENLPDLNDDNDDMSDFFRMEGHLWFQADLDDNITARISLEFDRAFNQGLNPGLAGDTNDLGFTGSDDLDLFLEEAFIKVQDIWGSAASVSVGRQFINFGDDPNADNFNQWWGPGFIYADSRTNDPLLISQLGSYEIDPFDAIVFTYELEQARIDIFHARDVDDVIGVYGDSQVFDDSDATITGIYASYFGLEGHQIDAYYSYNDQTVESGFGPLGFDGEHHMIGIRASGDINESIAYKGEVAYQFQDRTNEQISGNEIEAFAAQAGINYHPDSTYNPNVGFIYTLLQEDDNLSGFASPYEGKTYGQIAESIVKFYGGGVFSNMHVFNLNGGMEPMENVALSMDMYYFMLDEDIVVGNDEEDDGGFEVDGQVDYLFNENLTTFVGGGVLFPGDALEAAAGNNDDLTYFFRAGMKVHF